MAVDKRAEDVFRSLKRRCSGTQFFGRIDFQSTHLQLVRVAIARAAPAAYDKKCNCRAGCRQTNYLIRWTQAARGAAGWATVRLFLASSFLFIPLKFSQPIALHTLFPILFLFHSRNFFYLCHLNLIFSGQIIPTKSNDKFPKHICQNEANCAQRAKSLNRVCVFDCRK